VEADAILGATDKAREDEAYNALPQAERLAIERAINELKLAYHSDDHLLIRNQIEKLNQATMTLAEAIMNAAVGKALKGTNINA